MSKRTPTPWPRKRAKDTVLTAHVTHTNAPDRWFRLRLNNEQYRWQVADLTDTGWNPRDIGDDVPAIDEALDLMKATLTVGKGTIIEIEADPAHDRTILHGIIPRRVIAENGADWTDDVRGKWNGIDEQLPFELPHREVWATVNGARLLLITPVKSSSVYPVLFDINEGTFGALRVIAESSWHSESGGAPVSWDGGSRLSVLYPGMLLNEAWGDVRQELDLVKAYGPQETGRAVADFLLADDQQVAAAWLLERFDPKGQLTTAQVKEWTELMGQVTVSVSVNLEPYEELAACREKLRNDAAYASVAAALADPASTQAHELRRRLESVRDSGVVGDILGYSLGTLTAMTQ